MHDASSSSVAVIIIIVVIDHIIEVIDSRR